MSSIGRYPQRTVAGTTAPHEDPDYSDGRCDARVPSPWPQDRVAAAPATQGSEQSFVMQALASDTKRIFDPEIFVAGSSLAATPHQGSTARAGALRSRLRLALCE